MSTGLQIDINTGAVQSGHTQFRNRLINGDFRIMQRGTPAANISGGGAKVYTFDRWWFTQNSTASNSVQQLTSPGVGDFQYAARLQRPLNSTTTQTYVLGQALESQDSAPLKGQSLTVSFWLRAGANLSSTVQLVVSSGTGTDQDAILVPGGSWTGQSNFMLQTMTPSTTWQYYTFTATAPANCNQLCVWFIKSHAGTAGAADYVDIAGVQLEKGTVATPFELRPLSVELQLSQRYYVKCDDSYAFFFTDPGNNTAARGAVFFPVQMRAYPVVALQGNAAYQSTTNTAIDNVTAQNVGSFGFGSLYRPAGFISAAYGISMYTANAEL
jgi:hypothetical protein